MLLREEESRKDGQQRGFEKSRERGKELTQAGTAGRTAVTPGEWRLERTEEMVTKEIDRVYLSIYNFVTIRYDHLPSYNFEQTIF